MIRLSLPHVKGRSYDATKRRAGAEARRLRAVTAARDRFLTEGYAATTVASVAADAQVSVDTIYKTFGGKLGLLEAAWWRALEGNTGPPAEERADAAALGGDARSIIHTWATLSAEVAGETSQLFALIRALAVVDPAIDDLYQRIERSRSERMTHNARLLAATGALRPGLSVEQARDIMLAVSGHLPEPLLDRAGWSSTAYVDLVDRLLRAALLATPG
ncbi:MAG TPA: TetR family transcriptional regulator [Pedococcus sp.]|nr:TetR family transcriptional regulator [Pedococcus sp.]